MSLAGTTWRSINAHTPTTIRVLGLTPTGRVKVYNITRGSKQHRHKIFTIAQGHLFTCHVQIK